MRLLLISNSGDPPFAHCADEIAEFLNGRSVAFVTAAALNNEDTYFEKVRASLLANSVLDQGGEVSHLRWDNPDLSSLDRSSAVFIGGGNTYVLLQRLRQSGLLQELQRRTRRGLAYVGASAGANIAGPNILTTNDWNVVQLREFGGLDLVAFNVNPHYVTRGQSEGPTAETREVRIGEYLKLWSNPVVGIEEGALIRSVDGTFEVRGKGRVRLFVQQGPPTWFGVGSSIPVSPSAVGLD